MAPSPQGSDLTLSLELTTFADRDLLYAAMTDSSPLAKLIIRREVDLALPTFPQPAAYVRSTTAVDTVVPFTFSKDLDANVFAALSGGEGRLPGWNICSVNWNGRPYTYYQATNQPTQVYFLPDAFKVERQPTPPHAPSMAVSAVGADMANIQMTLSYLAVPVWNPARVAAAAPQLQQTWALQEPPNLALFQASNTTLVLSLPNPDGSAGNSVQPQKDALIDLMAGIKGSVTMGAAQFRQVYNALFDNTSTLLSGEVEVTVGDDKAHIPLLARISDMTIGIVEVSSVVDTHNNVLQVSVRNAIESPVKISALSGTILRGGNPIPSAITSTVPAIPTTLAPEATSAPAGQQAAGAVLATLAPKPGVAGEEAVGGMLGGLLSRPGPAGAQVVGPVEGVAALLLDSTCEAQLDLSNINAAPDPQAIWRTILVDQGANPITRQVTLKLVAAMLTKAAPLPSPPPAPGDIVMAVQVAFEGGQTATFDASQTPDAVGFLNQTVKLSVPIDAFVLSNAPIDTYRYRTDVITGAGLRTGTWATDNRDTIFVVPT